jgi:multiple antibiotic resistance protein
MLITFIQAIPFTYAALFPLLNPLGAAIIFLSLTQGLPDTALRKLALKVAINTAILLIIVLFAGSWVLRFFGITIPVVEVGGGLVVAYIGWSMLNQSGKFAFNNSSTLTTEKDASEMAFFPLTMPMTAGPGCIAVMLAVSAHEVRQPFIFTLLGQLGAVVGILLSAITVFLCYRYAERITRLLGKNGTQVIMRLAAFVNLCIGVQIIWHGITGLLATLNIN